MDELQAKLLIKKYNAGSCTEEEKSKVENWYVKLEYLCDSPTHEQTIAAKDKVWQRLMADRRNRTRLIYSRIAITAAAIVALAFGIWFFKAPVYTEPNTAAINDIAPGTNKAMVTFANGKTIKLSDAKTGVVVSDASLKYNDGTAVQQGVYKVDGGVAEMAINTPRGGTYRLVLSDGTNVWLNAATTLKFPSNFKNKRSRTVELSGEAYFEVSKDRTHPFVVRTTKQQVTVLGTQFNISSYADDSNVKTTLLEGLVSVSAGQQNAVLRPGQQSVSNGTAIIVQNIDVEEGIAWKNGEFQFRNESLGNIMKQVARWYDVEVVYENKVVANELLGGTISKYENVSKVLAVLESTGTVKFKIEGKRIIVTKS